MPTRCLQSHDKSLSVTKYKRILRPFTSKIGSLNQLHAKSPSLFDFSFNEEIGEKIEKNTQFKRRKLYESTQRSSSRPGSKDSVKCVRVVQTNINSSHDECDSGEDSEYELTFNEAELPIKETSTNERSIIDALVNPYTSEERMVALKQHLSPEVYQHYFDLFRIFKILISTICGTQMLNPNNSRVPKLSTLCSMKVGKLIAMNMKSTYYKLNHSILFDIKTLPKNFQIYHYYLSDEIDEWLSMDPENLSKTYRLEFVLGYVIHVLVFNSHSLLFCLIPVLVHWLHEIAGSNEFKCSRGLLNTIKELLFIEYSSFSNNYFEGIEMDLISDQEGKLNTSQSHEVFWLYHKIGYWKNLVNLLNSGDKFNDKYPVWLLNSLAFDERLSYNLVSKIETKYFHHGQLTEEIYRCILKNPLHPQKNKILVSIVTQLMAGTRVRLKLSTSVEELNNNMNSSHEEIARFVHVWLTPSFEGTILFDSFFGCNNLIVEGLLQACRFVMNVGNKISKQTESFQKDPKDSKFIRLFGSLKKFEVLKYSIQILHNYLLDSPDTLHFNSKITKFLAPRIVSLFTYGHNNDAEFKSFLRWIIRRSYENEVHLARKCFKVFYGNNLNTGDPLYIEIYRFLFTKSAFTN